MELIATKALFNHLVDATGLTTRDLAAQAKTSKTTISRLMTGKSRQCRSGLGPRIEKVLGVPVGSLFIEARLSRQGEPVTGQEAA